MLERTDCYARGFDGSRCKALNRETCDGCTFYKTAAELEAERAAAKKRIAGLPENERAYILGKYKVLDAPRSKKDEI